MQLGSSKSYLFGVAATRRTYFDSFLHSRGSRSYAKFEGQIVTTAHATAWKLEPIAEDAATLVVRINRLFLLIFRGDVLIQLAFHGRRGFRFVRRSIFRSWFELLLLVRARSLLNGRFFRRGKQVSAGIELSRQFCHSWQTYRRAFIETDVRDLRYVRDFLQFLLDLVDLLRKKSTHLEDEKHDYIHNSRLTLVRWFGPAGPITSSITLVVETRIVFTDRVIATVKRTTTDGTFAAT